MSLVVKQKRIEIELKALYMAADLGRLVRLRRTAMALSPDDLARLAAVSPNDIEAIETTGETSIYTAFRVLVALGMAISVAGN